MDELKVGQKLWCVIRRRKGQWVTVTKVGRKWAYLDWLDYRIDKKTHRINKITLFIDGGEYTSPGRCYLSQEECEQADQLNLAWFEFRRDCQRLYQRPEGMTLEKIQAVRELLGME